jgi:pimeloyl-ACP methyl ester carboxylesterase
MPLLGAPGLGPVLVRTGLAQRVLCRVIRTEGIWEGDVAGWFLDRLDAHVTQQVYGSFIYAEVVPALLGRHAGRRLHPPTLFLHGDRDAAIRPDLLRGLEDHADDSRLELLPGLGHFSLDQAPDVVVPKLVAFLA